MKNILIIVFLNLLFIHLQAQNQPNISIASVVLTDTSNVAINQLSVNAPFRYKIKYYLSSNPGLTYTDFIDLVINPLSTGIQDTLLDSLAFSYTAPFDSTTVIYDDIASSNRYGGGGGAVIVVVWPTYRSVSTPIISKKDSIKTNISLSIVSPTNWNPNIVFFPNPVNSSLFIAYTDKSCKIERVRLSNIWGQEILNKKGQIDTISTENLEKGLYLLEFWDAQNRKIVYKICKE